MLRIAQRRLARCVYGRLAGLFALRGPRHPEIAVAPGGVNMRHEPLAEMRLLSWVRCRHVKTGTEAEADAMIAKFGASAYNQAPVEANMKPAQTAPNPAGGHAPVWEISAARGIPSAAPDFKRQFGVAT
jgi:hypothetical protein